MSVAEGVGWATFERVYSALPGIEREQRGRESYWRVRP